MNSKNEDSQQSILTESFQNNNLINEKRNDVRKKSISLISVNTSIISEVIDEMVTKNLTTNNNDGYTDDFIANTYDETFDSRCSRYQQSKKLSSNSNRQYSKGIESLGISDEKKDYTESFESLSLEETEVQNIILNKNELNDLKRKDYVEYVKMKVKFEENKKANIKNMPVHQKQMEKLIKRVKNHKSKEAIFLDETYLDKKMNDFKNIKVNPFLVNKLITENSIQRIKNEYNGKISKFGNEIQLETAKLNMKSLANDIYLNTKMKQINRHVSAELQKYHQDHYISSILLIGDLAKDLPKPTDPPEAIWNRFMYRLDELKKQ